MEHLDEFKKILRHIMSRDLPPLSEEEIKQGIREIEALWLVGGVGELKLRYANTSLFLFPFLIRQFGVNDKKVLK